MECEWHLRSIYQALKEYAGHNSGRFPVGDDGSGLTALLRDGLLRKDQLNCPSARTFPAPPEGPGDTLRNEFSWLAAYWGGPTNYVDKTLSSRPFGDRFCDFRYRGGLSIDQKGEPILCDELTNHPTKFGYTPFGHVVYVGGKIVGFHGAAWGEAHRLFVAKQKEHPSTPGLSRTVLKP